MKYTIDLPYKSHELMALLRKEFNNYSGKQTRTTEEMISYALTEICHKHDSRQKYAAAQAQFEQAGWTVIQNAARYLWKLRKNEWHIVYYPRTEKLWDSLNNIRMTGLKPILRYLKTLKQPDGKLQPCMGCRYFQPGSIHRRGSQCEKNRKIRKINKEYFGICDDFKGR